METINNLLGLGVDAGHFTLCQLLLRALVTCFVMDLMLRIAGRRFMAQKNSFDVLLAFLIASMMSRAINGTTNFWGTFWLGLIIAAAYRLIAWMASTFHIFGILLKGKAEVLVADGVLQKRAMQLNHVSEDDLHEDIRLVGNIADLEKVKTATLERSGDISVVKKPQILNIQVADGVQTVRLFIE